MINISLAIPFICLFSAPTQVTETIYPNTCNVTFKDSVQTPVPFDDGAYYTNISYQFNMDLFFRDSNNFRLNIRSLDFVWNNKNYISNENEDNWHDTFNLSLSFTDDDIQNFKPSIKLSTLMNNDHLKVELYNDDTLLTYGEYGSDCSIEANSYVTLGFGMSDFLDQLYLYCDTATSGNFSYNEGYTNGYNDGSQNGYQNGYTDGYNEASDMDSTAVTIFTGICEVGLLPVNVFLGMLNFEVFGINIGGFVASLMTVSIIVIVIRIVLGAKSGGGE